MFGKTALVLAAAVFLSSTAVPASAVTLKVFEWEGYVLPLAEDFAAYAKSQGMDVKLEGLTDASGKPRFILTADDLYQTTRRGEADIVTPTHNYFKDSQGKLMKLLAPVDLAQVPNFKEIVPSLQKATYAEDNGKLLAVPLLAGGYLLAYNADRVKTPPTSWKVLADPAFKGRTSITGTQFEANIFAAGILAGVSPEKVYRFDTIEMDKTEPLLKAMLANKPVFWDYVPDVERMGKDIDIITDYGFSVFAANAAGQNWKFAETTEPSTIWIDNVSITAKAAEDPEKLKAAHLLLNYLLSAETQGKIALTFGTFIPNPKAADTVAAAERSKVRVPSADYFKPELLWQPLDDRTRNGFKQIWERSLKAAAE